MWFDVRARLAAIRGGEAAKPEAAPTPRLAGLAGLAAPDGQKPDPAPSLDPELARELAEERAAIMEYDGG